MKNSFQNAGKVLGIFISRDSEKTILEHLQKYLKSDAKKPYIIVTPNAEQLVSAQHDKAFAQMLNQADVALPDGFPVAALLGVSRIAGVEFMEELVRVAAKQSVAIGLIGGKPGLAVEAFDCLQKRQPGLLGFGMEAPDFEVRNETIELAKNDGKYKKIDEYIQEVVEKIKKHNVRVLFVGLGAPKQEYFIEYLARSLPPTYRSLIFMSVGGSFDVIAGRIKRAPLFIRSIGFEWLWRLLQEPWRWKRQLALFKFVFLVLSKKI